MKFGIFISELMINLMYQGYLDDMNSLARYSFLFYISQLGKIWYDREVNI